MPGIGVNYRAKISSSVIPVTRLGIVVLLLLCAALKRSTTLSRIVGKGAVSRSLPLLAAMPGRESDRYFTLLRDFFFLGAEEASADIRRFFIDTLVASTSSFTNFIDYFTDFLDLGTIDFDSSSVLTFTLGANVDTLLVENFLETFLFSVAIISG